MNEVPIESTGKETDIYLGISLGGGKADRTCIAVLEYFPQQKRVFLIRLFERIKSEGEISADQKIIEIIQGYSPRLRVIGLDSPWRLPTCLRCQLACPGYESCREPHISWMWNSYREKTRGKKPKKLFTPYTQRAVEGVMSETFQVPFFVNQAMGANAAPLLARSAFIKRRVAATIVEVFPEASLWRIGKRLNLSKSNLLNFKKAAVGETARRTILQTLSKSGLAFFYDTDLKALVEHPNSLNAFLCAYTGFLYSQGLTEKRPDNFPIEEDWIEVPL